MNKFALRLLVLVLISAIGVFYLLNRKLNKSSDLVKYVPSSSTAFVHISTKNIAKDVYRHGGFSFDSLRFLMEDIPYFNYVKDPRTTGINMYSEIFLFEDKFESNNYTALLASLNNPPKFSLFCKDLTQAGLLSVVELTAQPSTMLFSISRLRFSSRLTPARTSRLCTSLALLSTKRNDLPMDWKPLS